MPPSLTKSSNWWPSAKDSASSCLLWLELWLEWWLERRPEPLLLLLLFRELRRVNFNKSAGVQWE
jgi:hypothetical protein